MPRNRMVLIPSGSSGLIKAELVAHGGAMGLFAVRERNDIMREALTVGGEFWARFFLPKRYSNYALTLGYSVSDRWQKLKRRLGAPDTPLVFTGTLRAASIKGASADARATANKQTLLIRIPIGDHGGKVQANGKRKAYGIAPSVMAVLKSFPPNEVKAVAKVVGQAMANALQNRIQARMAVPDPGPVRNDLQAMTTSRRIA